MRLFRSHVNVVSAFVDSAVAMVSFPLALYLRLGDRAGLLFSSYMVPASICFAALMLSVLLITRAYRRVWRYTSLNDLTNLAKVTTISWLVFYVGLFQFTRLADFPRSAIIIHWLILMALLGFVRLCARAYTDRELLSRPSILQQTRPSVILVGAGPEAEMFIRESQRSGSFPYEVAAIIDDDAAKRGREIRHVRIYGPVADAEFVIAKFARRQVRIARMVICDQALPRSTLENLVQTAAVHNVPLARLPRLGELREGSAAAFEMKPVLVEDILGRPQVALDLGAMRGLVAGKRVLVTGAGGSIGSELSRQIAAFSPASLVLYDISEFQLYEIQRELEEDFSATPHFALVGDVRDFPHLSRCMAKHAPEIVFHAAAIKHVPMAENNVGQAVLTNVLGSKNVLEACAAHGVATLVQISTDKAVNPTSVMGASKRIAEMVAQAYAQHTPHAMRIVTVRFGNVLGSNGSVVPLFQRQIAKGGPVTVTHPEMVRYVMSIHEAVQLVLQAAVIGVADASERAPIFVLEMGEPIKILDLALQMIRLAGRVPYKEIDIRFTGIRAGEKMYEELFHDEENLLRTAHISIRKAKARRYEYAAMMQAIDALMDAARVDDDVTLRALLRSIVPEYSPFDSDTVSHESSAA